MWKSKTIACSETDIIRYKQGILKFGISRELKFNPNKEKFSEWMCDLLGKIPFKLKDSSIYDYKTYISQLIVNAYDAIASVYDPDINKKIPKDYIGLIKIEITVEEEDTGPVLTFRIRDNGLGIKSANTAQKRQKPTKYYGKDGDGFFYVFQFAHMMMGFINIVISDKEELNSNKMKTTANLSIPLKHFKIN